MSDPTPVTLNPSFSRNRNANISHMSTQLLNSPLAGETERFVRLARDPEIRRLAVDNGVHVLDYAAGQVGADIHWTK